MRRGRCGGRVSNEGVQSPHFSRKTREMGHPAAALPRCFTSSCVLQSRLRAAADFGPPPADADEEESPVVEEFWFFAFEGVADELENPSEYKKSQGVGPEAMHENAGDEDADRQKNQRDAQGVAGAVHRMLMAGGVLRDPLLAGAVA